MLVNSNLVLNLCDVKEKMSKYNKNYQYTQETLNKLKSYQVRHMNELEARDKSPETNENYLKSATMQMQRKSEQYQERIEKYENELVGKGMKKELRHPYIKAKSDEVYNLKKETDLLKKQLSIYQQLPPDFTQSQLAIAQIQEELKSLSEQFDDLVTTLFSANQ